MVLKNFLYFFIILTIFISCTKNDNNTYIVSEPQIFLNRVQSTDDTRNNINTDDYYFISPTPPRFEYTTIFNKYSLGENGVEHLEDYLYLGDLINLTREGLRILRNAIYAKHGYQFISNDLSEYFSQFSWYAANFTNVDYMLTEIDRRNISLIQMVENNYPKSHNEFIGNYGDWRPGIPHGLSNEGPNRLIVYPNGIFIAIWPRAYGWESEIDNINTLESYSAWKNNNWNYENFYYGLWSFDNNALKFDDETIIIGREQGVLWSDEIGVISSDNINHLFLDRMWYYYSSEIIIY